MLGNPSLGDNANTLDTITPVAAVVNVAMPPRVEATLTITTHEDDHNIWSGFLLSTDQNNSTTTSPTLVLRGGNWDTVDLRESIVAVLELADTLQCGSVVVCLPRKSSDRAADLKRLIHDFMYVGFEIVSQPFGTIEDKENYIMVGAEV